MRDFGKISSGVWQSKNFRKLDDKSKLLYLYIHTCPHANSIGCFYLPRGYIMTDLGWNDRAVDSALTDLCTALIQWNSEENIVKINRFLEFSPITNKSHAIGSVKKALSLPECSEKYSITKELGDIEYCREIDRLQTYIQTCVQPCDRPVLTETETETETETFKKSERKYIFEGKTIKLNTVDYEIWQTTFSAIPDFKATLHSADSWISGKPEKERRGWFHAIPQYLNNKHQKHLNDPSPEKKLGRQL